MPGVDAWPANVTKKSVAYRAKWLSRVFQDPKMGTAGTERGPEPDPGATIPAV